MKLKSRTYIAYYSGNKLLAIMKITNKKIKDMDNENSKVICIETFNEVNWTKGVIYTLLTQEYNWEIGENIGTNIRNFHWEIINNKNEIIAQIL